MKTIPVRTIEGSPFSTITIIREAAGAAPNGMNITQMRSRIRVLDAIDKANEKASSEIFLEDSDHTTLVEAVNVMPWARADRHLLQIIDDILGAKAVPAVKELN